MALLAIKIILKGCGFISFFVLGRPEDDVGPVYTTKQIELVKCGSCHGDHLHDVIIIICGILMYIYTCI